jgi:hypothetical protein
MTTDENKRVKVVLHDQGSDVETPWGKVVGSDGERTLVQLDNVPFLHAKPTYGDVLALLPDDNYGGKLTWDRNGMPFNEIAGSLHRDGGRFAVIVDYFADDAGRFGELTAWLEKDHDFACEGLMGPEDERPGRLYLAVPYASGAARVMAILDGNRCGFRFVLFHPRGGLAPVRGN